MTMPNEISEPAATPSGANGAANPDGSQPVDAQEPTTAGPEGDRDGEDRSNETLEERVRRFQSEADKRAAELNKFKKKLGGLHDWLDRLGGGDNVLGILQHYATHPRFAEFINELNASGRISTPLVEAQRAMPEDDEDEYLDPAVKTVRDELEKARAEIQRLSQQMTATQAAQGGEKFKSHVQKWLSRYEDLTDEEIERVRERGEATVNRLGAQITNLSETDVATLLRGTFTDDEWDALMDRRALRRLQNKQQRGTDSPSPVSISQNVPEKLDGLDHRKVWAEALRRIQ